MGTEKVLGISGGAIVEKSIVTGGGGGSMGPGIGIDESGIVSNIDGGRVARHAHEGDFNHQLLRYLNLPFFKDDGSQQNIALTSIGNLPFFDSLGNRNDVALVSPQAPVDVLQMQIFM